MRLIDSDDLKDLMYIACMGQDKAFVKVFERAIDDCPTIEPESLIPHGRWEVGEDVDIQCSVCGRDALTEGDYRQVRSLYCPNCGAKMDKA